MDRYCQFCATELTDGWCACEGLGPFAKEYQRAVTPTRYCYSCGVRIDGVGGQYAAHRADCIVHELAPTIPAPWNRDP